MSSPKYPGPGVSLTVDSKVVRAEINRLAEQSQYLDWDIPSQYDQLLRNADQIDQLSLLATLYETSSPFPPKGNPTTAFSIIDDHARSAVAAIFGFRPGGRVPPPRSMPPVFNKVVPKKDFQPTRRGHLTLVHSGPGLPKGNGGGNDAA